MQASVRTPRRLAPNSSAEVVLFGPNFLERSVDGRSISHQNNVESAIATAICKKSSNVGGKSEMRLVS
jgi:hypothetical protein